MNSWYDDISSAWKNDVGFLQVISDLSGLPVALWAPGDAEKSIRWTSMGTGEHPCFSSDSLRVSLERYGKGGPSIYIENDTFFYGVMTVGPFFLAIGPAAKKTVTDEVIEKYSFDHGMSSIIPNVKTDWETISRYLKLMHYHFLGTPPSREELSVHSENGEKWQPVGDLEAYELAQSENDRSHGIGMDFEKKLLSLVRSGDTAALRTFISGPTPDINDIGEVTDEEAKESEYLTVSIITLMTRAAVAGGVRPEAAHEMGDVYLRQLARAAARGEPISHISLKAMVDFTEAVRRSKEEKHDLSYVDACKDYIEKNLRRDIQVGDIAPAIGVSRTYLSRLFRQEEGITVQQYIQKEKCRHAARMLIYSDYPISQIAQYFGFSSQSYFGSCFQTWYGMTPNAYRKANHGDFTHD